MSRRRVFLLALVAFLLIPAAALAGTLFSDVTDGRTHFKGIEFVKSSGVALGCGDGTTYCPKDPVLREQMATFMYRLSGNDPATPPSVNADKLDGKDSTAFLQDATAFLGKTEKAADSDLLDGKDSTEFAGTAHNHTNAETTNEPGVVFNYATAVVGATSTPAAMISTTIRVPSDGYVKIEVSGNWQPGSGGTDYAFCQLQKGTVRAIDFTEPWFRLDESDPAVTDWRAFSAHTVLPIAAADNPSLFTFGQLLSLTCDEQAGAVSFDDVNISGTFFATKYAPIGIILPFGDEPSSGPGESSAIDTGE
ncbi:MAG: hypothetical protein P1T08_13795 [Acidimicrobiia bacterium]|nr:hypothetical protein [Acidimicrobiia bacterium]